MHLPTVSLTRTSRAAPTDQGDNLVESGRPTRQAARPAWVQANAPHAAAAAAHSGTQPTPGGAKSGGGGDAGTAGTAGGGGGQAAAPRRVWPYFLKRPCAALGGGTPQICVPQITWPPGVSFSMVQAGSRPDIHE